MNSLLRSCYSSDITCHTICSISGRGNERVQPVRLSGLRQLVRPHTRQRTMPSRSLVAHRFRISLMAFCLASDLMRLLPGQHVPRHGLAWIEAPLVADDPAVRLTHLLEVVD